MQTIVFVIDNSASMNQRCYLGTTLLDVAKGAVETFIKQRGNRTDKYMLITLEESAKAIKAGWKDSQNHGLVLNRLKSIVADGLTTVGQSLKLAFDLLGVNRHLSGIDTYGQGRSPFYLDPSMIIAITDGGKLSSRSSVSDEIHLPMSNVLPGSELTKEPFRWDQRLFSLVLRLPANATLEPEQLGSVPSDQSPISLMCEVTGGRSYSIKTQKTLMQCLDSLVQKVQSGVVLHFEKTESQKGNKNAMKTDLWEFVMGGTNKHKPPSVPLQPWHSLHRMIYVRNSPKSGMPVGHWPFPESYCPDPQAPSLPPRNAHPKLVFTSDDVEPMLLSTFPYDKYELEPSPLTQVLLEKKNPSICWQVYVENSGKQSNVCHPCGYLKASSNLSCVNIFVMPYNYPVLLPLMEQLQKMKMKPTPEWKRSFDDYVNMVPPYYINPLRKSLKQIGAPNHLISDVLGAGLSYTVTTYFKKLKEQTKMVAERFNSMLSTTNNSSKGVQVISHNKSISVTQFPNLQSILSNDDGMSLREIELNDFPGFFVGEHSYKSHILPRSFHNPFDVTRSKLLTQLKQMRLNFKQVVKSSLSQYEGLTDSKPSHALRIKLQDRMEAHNLPISQMGNYQEYMKLLPVPLREADPDVPKRLHTFGNPFKMAKEKGIMIDETEDYDGPSVNSGLGGKRKQNLQGGPPHKRKRSMSFTKAKYNVWKRRKTLSESDANELKPAALPEKHANNDTAADGNREKSVENLGKVTEPKTKPDPKIEQAESSEQSKHPNKAKAGQFSAKKGDFKGDKLQSAIANNDSIRVKMTAKIRAPGRHGNDVSALLGQLQGSKELKLGALKKVITEAKRFKRKHLIEICQQFKKGLK